MRAFVAGVVLSVLAITVAVEEKVQAQAVACNGCRLIGIRDIQGGLFTGRTEDLNLDIGAGSTDNPGNVVINYDVGRRVLIYDGHRHLLARFGPAGIVFYRNPKIRHP